MQEWVFGKGWTDVKLYDTSNKSQMAELKRDLEAYRNDGYAIRITNRRITN